MDLPGLYPEKTGGGVAISNEKVTANLLSRQYRDSKRPQRRNAEMQIGKLKLTSTADSDNTLAEGFAWSSWRLTGLG